MLKRFLLIFLVIPLLAFTGEFENGYVIKFSEPKVSPEKVIELAKKFLSQEQFHDVTPQNSHETQLRWGNASIWVTLKMRSANELQIDWLQLTGAVCVGNREIQGSNEIMVKLSNYLQEQAGALKVTPYDPRKQKSP